MMLLSLCVSQGYDVVCAHVNYRMRPTSDGEEEMVRDFCAAHGVPVRCLHPVQTEKDNFQKWAREARYDFYKDLCEEFKCDALLLGHQLDDHLENYLMSLERKSRSWYYGIPYRTYHHSMEILRPLINFRKKETRQFCLDNGVPFHDDESNASDKYTRNRIRHSLVEPADDEQIRKWLREIDDLNEKQEELLHMYEEKYGFHKPISFADFRKEEDQNTLLRWYICSYDHQFSYSEDGISEMVRVITSSRKNGFYQLHDGYELVYEYGKFYVWRPEEKYCYKLNEIEFIKTPYFEITDSGRIIEGVTVSKDDFPLTIRPYEHSDEIELRLGHKKVNRFMIDRKISRQKRHLWPVIVNREGRVIFVQGVGCDVLHYSVKPNMFMIELLNNK